MRFTHSKNLNFIFFLILVALYCPNEARAEFAGGVFKQGVCYIFGWMEGDLGGLLAVAAGVVAVFMGAAGNFKGVAAFVITALSAYTISNSVEFYFGNFNCGGAPAAQNNGPGGTIPNFGGNGLANPGVFQARLANPVTASSQVELPRLENEPVGEIHTRVTKSDSDPFQEDSLDNLENF